MPTTFDFFSTATLPNILTPEILEFAYRNGYFPMGEEDGSISWHNPEPRAIFPLETLVLPRSVRKVADKGLFEIRFNTHFDQVIHYCATTRESTWITEDVIAAYTELFERGLAHTVETWQNGELVGGLYGVSIGGAFFGESKFSLVSEASKVAFAKLVEHLKERGFTLLDSQYINHHTQMLGAIEIPRVEYLKRLATATQSSVSFL